MKLRIRWGEQNARLDVDSGGVTLEELKTKIKLEFHFDESYDCDLSLNAATFLSEDSQATLDSIGIVAGDLIHVLLLQDHPQHVEKLIVKNIVTPTSMAPMISDGECSNKFNSASSTLQSTDDVQDESAMCTDNEVCTSEDIRSDAHTESALEADVDEVVMNAEVNRYLNQPMLIRDASDNSLPQCLIDAISKWKPLNNHEAVTVVLHLLMTELGYKLKTHVSDEDLSWKIKGGLRLEYSYPQIEAVVFQLLCVPMMSQLLVHGTVRFSLDHFYKVHVQLKMADYMKSSNSDDCPAYRERELSKLSNIFKDGVAYPLLQHTLVEKNLPTMSGLSTFVYELQLNVLKYLDVTSLLRVSQTCHSLNEVAKEPILWRRIFLRDFGCRQEMSLSQDWIQIYKHRYTERKYSFRRRPFLGPPQFFSRYNPPPPVFNPYPPGFIIGGDYDLNPPNLRNPFGIPDPLLFRPNHPPVIPRPWPPGGLEPMDMMMDQQLLPSVHPLVNLSSNPSNNIFAGRNSTRSMKMPRYF